MGLQRENSIPGFEGMETQRGPSLQEFTGLNLEYLMNTNTGISSSYVLLII